MPIGVIVNAAAIVIGGLAGGVFSNKGKENNKDSILVIIGVCAMAMGINSIVKMQNLPAVVLAVILGFIIGEAAKLSDKITNLFRKLVNKLGNTNADKEYMDKLVALAVIFCASSTGIYGALLSGMTGDHSILITKAIMDLFTAGIFAFTLSYVVALLGVFQFVILFLLFLCSKLIMPFLSQEMILDFIACGGIILIATGLKVAKIKEINIANLTPGLILVIPLSYIFTLIF